MIPGEQFIENVNFWGLKIFEKYCDLVLSMFFHFDPDATIIPVFFHRTC